MYGLITELERSPLKRLLLEYIHVHALYIRDCQIFTREWVFAHRCIPQTLRVKRIFVIFILIFRTKSMHPLVLF